MSSIGLIRGIKAPDRSFRSNPLHGRPDGLHVNPRFFFLLLLFLGALYTTDAQNYQPFTPLRVIETEHFDIIFPAQSEETARTLAGKAEGIYRKVSGLLGIDLPRRVPVSITPHTDEFNGYMNPLPYPHIMLFDTPPVLESLRFENSLEDLFLHELTHAVSANTRSPALESLRKIFGGWVSPAGFTAPWFMIEGASVSFESLNGFGRSNDPLVKGRIRQNIHEDGKTGRTFMTPFQAMGVYDLPPSARIYYEYGGLFSSWLQRKYGMEKYAELWRAMGNSYHFSVFFYNNGYYHIFKTVYGIPFLEAWDNFKEDFRITGIEENHEGLVRGGPSIINDIAVGGGRVYFLDPIAQALMIYDDRGLDPGETGGTESGGGNGEDIKFKALIPMDSAAYGLDVSEDGTKVLVSTYRRRGAISGQLSQAVVIEYDAQTRFSTGRRWEGLYHGRYFRDGVIGFRSHRHISRLVYCPPGGDEEVLLKGSDELYFSHPSALDKGRIVFSFSEKGIRGLGVYHYETKEASSFVSDLPDDTERWRSIRDLRVSEGKILFAFNHDDRLYKLGMINVDPPGDTFTVVFTERDFSGGVFRPVISGGDIYYRAEFSAWNALMRYPETALTLGGIRTDLRLEPWDEARRAVAGLPGTEAGDKPDQWQGLVPPDKPYWFFKYMNPLNLWLPLPLIRNMGGQTSIDGAGIFSFMADPADTNLVFLYAFADLRHTMADIDLHWINYYLGFPLDIRLVDTVTGTDPERPVRWTTGSLTATLRFPLGNERRSLSFYGGLGIVGQAARNLRYVSLDTSAYGWNYQEINPSGLAGLSVSNMRRFFWETFGQGVSAGTYVRYALGETLPRLEFFLSFAAEPLPLRGTMYGALEQRGMNLYGRSPRYGMASFDRYTPVEYPNAGIVTHRLFGAEMEIKLFSLELQRSFSHFYFNRIFASLGWRGALFDNQETATGDPMGEFRVVHSALFRLGTTISAAPVTVLPVKLHPSFWAALRLSDLPEDNFILNALHLGFSFSITY